MKTVAEKLQFKPGNTVWISPAEAWTRALLEPLPEGASFGDHLEGADGAVLFIHDEAELDALLPEHETHFAGVRSMWIAYPKGNKSDLNRDTLWAKMERRGLRAVANIALDETWSSVRFRP